MKQDSIQDTSMATTLHADAPTPRYFNRELSWLEFNQRVLHEAIDPRTPLLERAGFLGIFTSNLDEYFMKRVGGLKRQIATGMVARSADGMTAQQQIAAIRAAVLPMLLQQARCYTEEIKPALKAQNIHLLSWDELTAEELAAAPGYFRTNVFPVLTPLAVDPGHPFPFISNLSESLGVMLEHPDYPERVFARVKIPTVLQRWISLTQFFPGASATPLKGGYRFIHIQELIRNNLGDLFPAMKVVSVMPFRVTRNADIERDEEDAEDLLELMEQELRARRFARVVRLEHGPNPDPWMLQFLLEELELTEQDVYELSAELDYTDLRSLLDLPLPQFKHEPWTGTIPLPLADEEADIFTAIRANDLLVHHPYESFTASVERFIRAAVHDPKVVAIKMTLYRTGEESPFIKLLAQAAESGKQVACIVEVKARFDEERNIQVAQKLEKAGVHVVYGLVGFKTHTKVALVVRSEPEGLRSYVHIGTGNYHSGTARLYTDLGLFTTKPDLANDVVELFHNLTGRGLNRSFRKLLVAPINLKVRLLEMIRREIENARQGGPARIIAKMNSLEDQEIIGALYEASAAGVQIDLIVRGFCCLRPGVPGLSDNIRVISVIGRFLEHSRIFFFQNGANDPVDGEYYIGSADWMYRNLANRVEAVAPIEDRNHRSRCWQAIRIMLEDQRQAWELQPDGAYIQRQPSSPETQLGTHKALMKLATQYWRE